MKPITFIPSVFPEARSMGISTRAYYALQFWLGTTKVTREEVAAHLRQDAKKLRAVKNVGKKTVDELIAWSGIERRCYACGQVLP